MIIEYMIKTGYIDHLIDNATKAKFSKPIREFIFEDLEQLNDIDKAIYIIEEINANKEKTFNDFLAYKDSKKRNCPKANNPSNILYVGSSTTNVKGRIKQHIEEAPIRTYALHFKHWFKGKYKITILVYDEPNEVLQIIEDNIANNLKPAFGKMGGNNK